MHSKGSISIIILIGALFLAMLSQIALIFVTKSKSVILEDLQDYQLRRLCGSVAETTLTNTFLNGTENWPEITLEPGHYQVNVSVTRESSEDGLINYVVVGATANNDKAFYLKKLFVNPPNVLQEKVKNYAIVYKSTLTGENFLTNSNLYTSTNEEVLPNVKFLNGKALTTMTSELASQDGFSSKFYYIPTNNEFTFKANGKFYGSTVFVNSKTINILNNCTFYDRIMIISGAGNINIGKNVLLNKAIIAAYGTVTIDSGSKINGLITGNRIVLKGPVQISRDEEVVTPFSSAYFLTNSN